jgi:23S rRNA (guanine745-N1)-methyltransferase
MRVISSPTLALFADLLLCPTCGARHLQPVEGTLSCPAGHTFNVARHGYVSLLSSMRATSGDNPAMVRARDRFLSSGGYAPIRSSVARLTSHAAPENATLVDIGCGTGYYLAGVLEELPGARGLGMDTSVHALRFAARAHERAAAATWDVFRPLPLGDSVTDVVLDIFAPRNPAEFRRVLRPSGRLIVVRPDSTHMTELREVIPGMVSIDPEKEQRLSRALDPYFEAITTEQVEYSMSLADVDARDMIAMTPSARHVSHADLIADHSFPDGVTVSVLVTVYRPR